MVLKVYNPHLRLPASPFAHPPPINNGSQFHLRAELARVRDTALILHASAIPGLPRARAPNCRHHSLRGQFVLLRARKRLF